MHNNIAIEKFVDPINLKNEIFNRFSSAEKELILACNAYNSAIRYYGDKGKKLIKVTMGTKIGIIVKDTNNSECIYSFELDQSKFSGLLRKYRHESEIRQIIRNLFTS
ncbi:hypothetical protein L3V83_12015 [Thiotrichales bacterium 19X7-9]|nr:hypothetical protein [Thiotrichales bacterium 19X7-9]